MPTVSYFSPLVPVEWIAAHGLHPRRLIPRGRAAGRGIPRGLCPFAAAVMDELASLANDSPAVLLCTCDQLRHVAAVLDQRGLAPVFLLTLPATWQTAAAERLCRDALERLGDWLADHGGHRPRPDELVRVLRQYETARQSILSSRERLSAKQFALSLADPLGECEVHRVGPVCRAGLANEKPRPAGGTYSRLALVGGPMLADDYELYALIERLGGQIALNAMEDGERTLPTLSADRVREDPLGALIEAYYGQLPDAFRRPNHRLHQWLRAQLAARRIEGLILWRYVWCDLWHAELGRLVEECGVPVLDLDAGPPDPGARARIEGRLEAFLETLAHARHAEALP
jgi:benzoyl-CoA reductase/2-hydroxyglutaryl-CoA dehydratase subunit BcrC/BadD/HgdB